MASTTVSANDFNASLKELVRTGVWKNHYEAAQGENDLYYYEVDKYLAAAKYLRSRYSASYINNILNEHVDDSAEEFDTFCNNAFINAKAKDLKEDKNGNVTSKTKDSFVTMHNYVEHNNYYRCLFGLPNDEATIDDYIYPDGYYNTQRDVMQNCKFSFDVTKAEIILSGDPSPFDDPTDFNPNTHMEDYNISRAMFSSDEDFNKALKEMVDVHIYVKKTNSLFLIKRADLLNVYNNDNYDTWENRVPDGVEEVKPSLIPLHLWPYRQRTLYVSTDDFAKIQEAHKGDRNFYYLEYMGRKKIHPYIARLAERFDLLYLAASDPPVLADTFRDCYEACRQYAIRVFYTDAYRNTQGNYYEGFIGMSILFMAINQMYFKYLDVDIDRNFFDLESLKVIYEAYGVPFYNKIPIQYHKKVVKKINKLICYKGCEQVFTDLCEIFNYDILGIYQYYLVKERKYDDNDIPITAYTPKLDAGGHIVYDEYGSPVMIEDYSKMYDFYFLKCNINEDPFPQLMDDNNKKQYEIVAIPDKYWFDDDDDTIERVTQEEYNYIETKYIGVQVMFSITELLYESAYFMRMLMDNKKATSRIGINYARQNIDVNLFDFIIYIFAMICKKNGYEGSIPSTPSAIARIYGWNFKGLFEKLKETSLQGLCIEKDFDNSNNLDEINSMTKKLIIDELCKTGYGIKAEGNGIVTAITPTGLHVQYDAIDENTPARDAEYEFAHFDVKFQTDLITGIRFKEGDLLLYSNQTNLIWHGKVIQPSEVSSWMTVNKWLQSTEEGKELYTKLIDLLQKTDFANITQFSEMESAYHAMLDVMHLIDDRILASKDRNEFNAYSHLKRIISTTELIDSVYDSGNGKAASTYEELLKSRNVDLYVLLKDMTETELITELDYALVQLRKICDDLKYIEFIDSLDMEIITEYLYKFLRFFKSAKVDLMDFNVIFKIDSRTENLLKLLDDMAGESHKVYIDEDLAYILMSDQIYSASTLVKWVDRQIDIHFDDYLRQKSCKVYVNDGMHSRESYGQVLVYNEAEWAKISKNNPSTTRWLPYYVQEQVGSMHQLNATHHTSGDILYFWVPNYWLEYDPSKMDQYKKDLPPFEYEDESAYFVRMRQKIDSNYQYLQEFSNFCKNAYDDFSIYEMSYYPTDVIVKSAENNTASKPYVYTPRYLTELHNILIQNANPVSNPYLTLHIEQDGIEILKYTIKSGTNYFSPEMMIPGKSNLRFWIENNRNEDKFDMVIRFMRCMNSTFRTEITSHTVKTDIRDTGLSLMWDTDDIYAQKHFSSGFHDVINKNGIKDVLIKKSENIIE